MSEGSRPPHDAPSALSREGPSSGHFPPNQSKGLPSYLVPGENLAPDPGSGEDPTPLRATARPRRPIQIPTVSEFGSDADGRGRRLFPLGRRRRAMEGGGGLDEREGKKQRDARRTPVLVCGTLGRKDTHTWTSTFNNRSFEKWVKFR